MSKLASPYYPPRARWRLPFSRFGAAARRHLALRHVRSPGAVSAGSLVALVAAMLVPGLAFYLRGSRFWGKLAMAASVLCVLAFLVWLGYPAGNLAFGLLLSIHCTSAVHFFEPQLVDGTFGKRMGASFAALVLLGGLVYLPARHLLQERCFMPITVRGQVVVVRAFASTDPIERGDWIAYSLNAELGTHQVYVRSGLGLGPVLALPGDQVHFAKTAFKINSVQRARLGHMPEAGELAVPQNCWFVWPDVDIRGHGAVSENEIAKTLMGMAVIKKNQFIGKPFKRWFWRRQVLS